MLGTIDIGRVFLDYIELRSAVREGAGYGARMPQDTNGILVRVNEAGVPSGTPSPTVTCQQKGTTAWGSCDEKTGACRVNLTTTPPLITPCTIRVAVNHTFTPVTTSFLQRFGMGPINMRVSASMTVLR